MPRHKEPEEEPEDDSGLYAGDDDEVSDWQDFLEDHDFLDGLDYLDDIFDYLEDDDWYEET